MIGVVIPVYAHQPERIEYLDLCLKSLKRQTEPYLGIVVDDSSPLYEDVKRTVGDNDRIRLIQRTRDKDDLCTASNALNFGIDKLLDHDQQIVGSSEHVDAICYLHSDDLLAVQGLKHRRELLGHKSAFVFSDIFRIDGYSRLTDVRRGIIDREYNYGLFPHHTSMWSADLLQRIRDYAVSRYDGQKGVFDHRFFAGEDRDVTITTFEYLQNKAIEPSKVHVPTYIYRRHEVSITHENSKKDKQKNQDAVDEKHGLKPIRETLREKMMKDLPWSLGNALPPQIKNILRPIKAHMKKYKTTVISETIDDPLIGTF